jgi:predicted dehydrogenase
MPTSTSVPSSASTRRQFLQGLAATAAVSPFLALPARGATLTKVRHASIGSSGQAFSDLRSFAKHPAFELVAVADVDLCAVEKLQEMFPKVRIYQDWRELLKKESKQIDSVNVSTPDHMHAAIAMEAMKRGKPVYCQKPLASTLHEVRQLTETARKRRLLTQMGIQISSTAPQRLGEALARSGVVGKIKEVHAICAKSWGDEQPLPTDADPIPPAFNWDEWLGVSEPRPFKRTLYHPGNWRKRVGFGTGTLGDMGCHIFSPPYRALKLTAPTSITSHGPAPTEQNWATRAKFHYVYPGTEYTAGPTLDFWWYDGGELPPASVLEAAGYTGDKPPDGVILIGTEGVLLVPHMKPPVILPEARATAAADTVARLTQEIAATPRDHYAEFIDGVLAGGTQPLSTSFDYAGPLTESVILGNIAGRFPDQALEFDTRTLSFPKQKDANIYVTRSYRKGWKI